MEEVAKAQFFFLLLGSVPPISAATLTITTTSMIGFTVTISITIIKALICNTVCTYAEFSIFNDMLSVIMPSVVVRSVVAPISGSCNEVIRM
jgi:hypothetical protein